MPPVAPAIPDPRPVDRDGDAIDDELEAAPPSDESVRVEAVFDRPLTQRSLDVFARAGGVVTYVFRAVSYGFVGTVPRRALRPLARALGPRLVLLQGGRVVERHLDEATRTGRARPVWAPSFGGGYNGAPDINIAIMDTGVDGTHTDLAGRSVGWKDYTPDDVATPTDIDGHGSHVAGIAVGSGEAFGLGPGPLVYTDSGDLTGTADANFLPSPVHLPASFDVTSFATWVGGGSSTLSLRREADGASTSYAIVSSVNGASPLSLAFSGSAANARFTFALAQSGTTIGRFATVNTIASYPAVGDGFPALRGVASGSGWFGAKIFPASGTASSTDIGIAMDDLVVRRTASNLKVCNMSFGILGGGIDTGLRAKANTMVANGMVVVASNGNNGAGVVTADPARAANVIAVGATNDVNQLTQYTSAGILASGAGDDDKPDLLAPGGSYYRSRILSVDSNSADAASATFTDVRANDYANLAGTSMAAPFVAGAAALVIDALQRSGTTWSWSGTDSPFLVKTLLLASATETNDVREVGSGSPTLGRSAQPRDRYEGFGLVNPDAAIEAATLPYADFSATTTGSTYDRRAWGRRLAVAGGSTVRFDLTVSSGADFDVYLYASTPGPNGRPVLLAAGDSGAAGTNETAFWTASSATTILVLVKRISGSGTFAIAASTFTCGNGAAEPGEQCDDGNTLAGDCCSATCQLERAGSPCSDGSACTPTDACDGAGTCVGSNAVTCTALDECHDVGSCAPATGVCSAPAKPDGAPCGSDGSCVAGTCVPAVVDAGVDAETDAGVEDARAPGDGGATEDAGSDGGPPTIDAGVAPAPPDAAADAPIADATPEAPAELLGGGGCSCVTGAAPRPDVGPIAGVVGLAALRRRRRRSSPNDRRNGCKIGSGGEGT